MRKILDGTHGGKEEVHGVDVVVVHRVPRRDFRSPALLHGEDFLLRLLDTLRERLVVGLHLRVALVAFLRSRPLSADLEMTPYRTAPMMADSTRLTMFQTIT